MSAVSLTIATDSLRSLPVGASYSDRSGQASVKVSRMAATETEPEYIYVYATCDSLELQCERYERTIHSIHRDYAEQIRSLEASLSAAEQDLLAIKKESSNVIGTALKWFFIGLIVGVIVTTIINLKLNKR